MMIRTSLAAGRTIEFDQKHIVTLELLELSQEAPPTLLVTLVGRGGESITITEAAVIAQLWKKGKKEKKDKT